MKTTLAALVEGGVDFFRQRWTERKLQAVDKARPSLSPAATILVRVGDNAILGVRYTWKGRTERMSKMMGDAVPDKADEARELVLREPFLEIGVKELKSKVDLAVDRGAKWLQSKYGLRASRPEGLWWGPSMRYYFLYSLERALIVAGVSSARRSRSRRGIARRRNGFRRGRGRSGGR
jgi:hypothetical protein